LFLKGRASFQPFIPESTTTSLNLLLCSDRLFVAILILELYLLWWRRLYLLWSRRLQSRNGGRGNRCNEEVGLGINRGRIISARC